MLMPVRFSYLDFGIGTVSRPIGETTVTVGVRGSTGAPALARQRWTTPATPGHYCIQVELIWEDDANPANNLGQRNVDVSPLNSPTARFAFAVRNAAATERTVRFELDGYTVQTLAVCDPPEAAEAPELSAPEVDARVREAQRRHGREHHALADGWLVEAPTALQLRPDQQRTVEVIATAPDGFEGRQAINVHALAGDELLGGVTLYCVGRVEEHDR